MNRNLLAHLLLCLCVAGAKKTGAQQYKLAAGLRLGSPIALSAKYFPSEKGAVEAFIGHRSYPETWYAYRYSWTVIGATYAFYKPIKEIDRLQWFAGGGGALFLWNWGQNSYYASQYASLTGGLVLHGGFDYTFQSTPINMSLDWMPIYSLSDYDGGFYAGYGAISVRYILKQ